MSFKARLTVEEHAVEAITSHVQSGGSLRSTGHQEKAIRLMLHVLSLTQGCVFGQLCLPAS